LDSKTHETDFWLIIYPVPPLSLPATLQLSNREKRIQQRICQQLQKHARGLECDILQVIERGQRPMRRIGALQRLSHTLSVHARQRRGDNLKFKMAEAERKHGLEKTAYEYWYDSLWQSFHEPSPERFLALIPHVGSQLDPIASKFRRSAIGTLPDKAGSRRIFPGSCFVQDGLISLWHFVREYINYPSVVSASVMHYGICVLHPFSDGNGRLARILFNVLIYRGNSRNYIPLRQIFNASDFGYEIRLHEMDDTQCWEKLIWFFHDLLLSYDRIYRKALHPRETLIFS